MMSPSRSPEGVLVGDLEEVGEGFGAFAIEAADGEADFVDGLDDLVDLVAEDERGEVEHGAGAHAGAEIGGAGGEVAETFVPGEADLFLQFGVQFVEGGMGGGEIEAGADALHAEVVLFIDHDGEGLLAVDDRGAAGGFGGLFAGDEVFLDEDLFADGVEVGEVLGEAVLHAAEGFDARLEFLHDGGAVLLFGPAGEGGAFEVAGKPDAAGEDDIAAGAIVLHPFGGTAEEGGEFHHGKQRDRIRVQVDRAARLKPSA